MNPLSRLRTLWQRWKLDLAALQRADDGRRKVEQRLLAEAQRWLEHLKAHPLPAGGRPQVIGLAAHYGPAELAPFVRSLRGSGYEGDITLLSFGSTPATAQFLREHRVRMHPFTALGAMPMSMNSSRMYECIDVLLDPLLNAPEQAFDNLVLLTDVRDVVFQGDPFADLPEGRLLGFLETARTLGECPINRDWLQRASGPALLAELAARPVSCAGTVIGTRSAVLEYLLHMVRLLAAVDPQHRYSGVDQAIHNVILWKGLVAGSQPVPNGQAVFTIPDSAGSYQVDGERVGTPERAFPAVVHQYDRHPELVTQIQRRWGLHISS